MAVALGTIGLKERLRRWIPRLLGVVPLLVFLAGLFELGVNQSGLIMAGILTLLIAGLLILYTEISLLSFPCEAPNNRLLRKLHRPLARLSSRASETAQKREKPWWARAAARFLQAVIATPLGGIAKDLDYKSVKNTPIDLDILRQLMYPSGAEDNESRRNAEEQDFKIRHMHLVAINSQPLPDPAHENIDVSQPRWLQRIEVSGGTVQVEYATPPNDIHVAQVVRCSFVPYPKSVGRFEFPYTICWCIEDKSLHCHPTMETATISVEISGQPDGEQPGSKPGNESGDQSTLGSFHFLNNEILSKGQTWIRRGRWLMQYLLQLRIQVVITLICWLLFQTQQVRDVLLALMLDQKPMGFVWATLFGTALSLLLWHSARQLTRLFPEIHRIRKSGSGNFSLPNTGIFSPSFELLLFLIAWLSVVLFTVPIAREAFQDEAQSYAWAQHLLAPYALFLVGAIFIALWRLLDQPKSTWKPPFPARFATFFVIGLIAPLVAQLLGANTLPSIMGSLAVLFWFLCILLIVATTIFRFSVVSGFPLLSLLLVAYYLININRLNDNHAIRVRPLNNRSQHIADLDANQTLPSLEQKLDDWIQAREADGIFKAYINAGKEYPIYVISAQGGGIYAAYHTAKSLATLTESIPTFPEHIFAISSVSGGSIGSTIYRMALSSQSQSCHASDPLSATSLSERIDYYFESRDSLATILASLLFGDVTQRIFPLPVAHWDRALGLELSFENRHAQPVIWNTTNKCYQPIKLDGSFFLDQDRPFASASEASKQAQAPQLASSESKSVANAADTRISERLPYLVLNTTIVENGQRFILAPFQLSHQFSSSGQTDAEFHQPWLRRSEKPTLQDLRFSTAASLSARFPIASPYGFFSDARDRRLVDGGLYDNSGAITAQEIVASLKNIIDHRCTHPPDANSYCYLKVVPIAIVDQKAVSLTASVNDGANRRRPLRIFGWSALEAVLSSREARLQKAADLFGRSGTSEATNTPSSRSNAQLPQLRTSQAGPTRASICGSSGAQSNVDVDRTQRSSDAFAMEDFGFGCEPLRILLNKEFRLGDGNRVYSIPLGWTISCQAKAFINDQIQPLDIWSRREHRRHEWLGRPADHHGIPCEQGKTVVRRPLEGIPSGAGGIRPLSWPFWNLIMRLEREISLEKNI